MRHERSRVHSGTRTTNCCAVAQTVFADAQREDRPLTRHLVCRYDMFIYIYQVQTQTVDTQRPRDAT